MRTTIGVARRRKKNRLFQKAKGYTGGRRRLLRSHERDAVAGRGVCLPRPPRTQARIPQAVDHPHQRGLPRTGPAVQRVHRRPATRRKSSSIARRSQSWRSTTRPRLTRSSKKRKRRLAYEHRLSREAATSCSRAASAPGILSRQDIHQAPKGRRLAPLRIAVAPPGLLVVDWGHVSGAIAAGYTPRPLRGRSRSTSLWEASPTPIFDTPWPTKSCSTKPPMPSGRQ